MKLQVNILARELYLKFAPMDLDSDETSRDINTAVLHRMSVRIIWAVFEKVSQYQEILFFKISMSVFPRTNSQNEFSLRQLNAPCSQRLRNYEHLPQGWQP